jgi:hypothetical protein
VDKKPANNINPTPVNDTGDKRVILSIRKAVVLESKAFAGVPGRIITPETDSPTIETPDAVIAKGPALLFSTYNPDFIQIVTGLFTKEILLARLMAFANVK